MIQREQIQAFVDEVVRHFHPERIVLFGSHAYGIATADSDVDLLIVMNYQGHSAVQAAQIRKQIRAGFPLDLLVRSPAAIRKRLAMNDFFITEVLQRGETLYEARHAGVGR